MNADLTHFSRVNAVEHCADRDNYGNGSLLQVIPGAIKQYMEELARDKNDVSGRDE